MRRCVTIAMIIIINGKENGNIAKNLTHENDHKLTRSAKRCKGSQETHVTKDTLQKHTAQRQPWVGTGARAGH